MRADFSDKRKIEVHYRIVSDLRALVKNSGLLGYSKSEKAGLISLLRSHDVSTRKFMEGAQEG